MALREEIDQASMFEEIVGTSAALQRVLSLLTKVALTDASVLVTGETGTGKETQECNLGLGWNHAHGSLLDAGIED